MDYLNIFLFVLAYIAIGVIVMLLTLKIIGRRICREAKSTLIFISVFWILFVALYIVLFLKEVLVDVLRTAYEEIFM